MRKGYVVREKGYEYNDNWYDHEPSQDKYTEIFDDEKSAIAHAKKTAADFLSGRSVYDYFNEQPYLSKLKNIVGEYFSVEVEVDNIWELIKDDISQVLCVEIEDGDPCIINYSDGAKMYYKNNKLHRVGKPAIERADGTWEYYFMGRKHRIDGPAEYSSYPDEGFYVDGEYIYGKEEYREAVATWIEEHREYQINTII